MNSVTVSIVKESTNTQSLLLFFYRMHLVNVTVLYIFIIRMSLSSVAGNIIWKLKEKPAIFGTNIHLVCHLPNTTSCCNADRKWNVGYHYTLIILKGWSHNTSQYKEDLNEKERVSVLTIFSLSEQDVNIPYECVYGFQKYQFSLELTEDVFEFHPTEKLPIEPEIKGYDISFDKQFKKVFPKPLCRAALGIENLTSFLIVTTKRNGLLYDVSLKFRYQSSKTPCKKSLSVFCTVGKTMFTVVDHKICSSSKAEDSGPLTITIIVVATVAVIFVVNAVILFWQRDRFTAFLKRMQNNEVPQTEEEIDLKSTIIN